MDPAASSSPSSTSLQPLPETRQALAELVALEAPDLDVRLLELGRLARSAVPDLVGLSLSVVQDGVTFTLVAPNELLAALDATQYIDGGPCVEAVEHPQSPIEADMDDPLDEDRWSLFASASAAAGVASTLSMSILDAQGQVTGGINLYASTRQAFSGRHETLADTLGASAEGIVTDADLGFATRERARAAPAVLLAQADVETAVGLLAAYYGVDVDDAHERLLDAARQAGVDPAVVARVLILSRWE
jgi:GAF domain-containing protein